jgi:hypothetical protein
MVKRVDGATGNYVTRTFPFLTNLAKSIIATCINSINRNE